MNKYLEFLRKIKSVAFATTDGQNPHVRIADVMLVEDDQLFFLVPRGKPFYRQLKQNPRLALVGMDRTYKSVRITGNIEFVDRSYVDKIFEANPMMNDLYGGEKRDILEAYRMKSGVGDVFDLSVTPPFRERFAFGEETVNSVGYRINSECKSCGDCIDACPESCIVEGETYSINGTNCLECGRCMEVCNFDAIDAPQAFDNVV
ncbi:MAG: pyridoxamine 5'-phosphate oxidase family protein [Marinilabiliaceae bacterium]|nr:pyridoxamine 5'-phosphate oxidase family protein [Marinilabiliaceae bacterium]